MEPDHTFRVVHPYTGEVAIETPSWDEATTEHYSRNTHDESVPRVTWTLYLVDSDGRVLPIRFD